MVRQIRTPLHRRTTKLSIELLRLVLGGVHPIQSGADNAITVCCVRLVNLTDPFRSLNSVFPVFLLIGVVGRGPITSLLAPPVFAIRDIVKISCDEAERRGRVPDAGSDAPTQIPTEL